MLLNDIMSMVDEEEVEVPEGADPEDIDYDAEGLRVIHAALIRAALRVEVALEKAGEL
jgi:hypothetical protein